MGRGPCVADLVEWPCERRQKAVLSKWQQCVVEKQGLYILQPRGKLQKRATFVQTDGWTDGRTNKGFFTKSVGRDREPTVLQQVLQSIPLVKSPLFPTSKTSQDATTSCKADAREAITSSCDKMSRDAVRDRTVEQYDYRRTMALRTMALRTTWCKGSFKKRRPAVCRIGLQGRLMMTLAA